MFAARCGRVLLKKQKAAARPDDPVCFNVSFHLSSTQQPRKPHTISLQHAPPTIPTTPTHQHVVKTACTAVGRRRGRDINRMQAGEAFLYFVVEAMLTLLESPADAVASVIPWLLQYGDEPARITPQIMRTFFKAASPELQQAIRERASTYITSAEGLADMLAQAPKLLAVADDMEETGVFAINSPLGRLVRTVLLSLSEAELTTGSLDSVSAVDAVSMLFTNEDVDLATHQIRSAPALLSLLVFRCSLSPTPQTPACRSFACLSHARFSSSSHVRHTPSAEHSTAVRDYSASRDVWVWLYDIAPREVMHPSTITSDLSGAQYAALARAQNEISFGHRQAALDFVFESVTLAQALGDERCLRYALAWIATLEPDHAKAISLLKLFMEKEDADPLLRAKMSAQLAFRLTTQDTPLVEYVLLAPVPVFQNQ
ncbi:uncharacterized protein MONBRDRAFT_22260 [Monosiga brevicollis MX1]|uniref:Anaphase-promoting complex subunit 5 n=1 Tax=Monosiga brevicollis TaxID=81824 RepID=A9UQ19_MONBE|nr:uncharacterized protein MONBRDRAFT_22260 [Monosiga brevicollis MX1]EDQ92970.1 predicted protein [Monosiga brevicollis MX1]|eukprot:XP_001742732.1 hypothetical protein [Monosiga brevicollis MX1]